MKPDIDFEEQRTRIDKMIIDMEHDVKKRMNWQAQQDERGERAKAQDKQWKIQKKHWEKQDKYRTTTVIIAMILTAFVTVAIDKL